VCEKDKRPMNATEAADKSGGGRLTLDQLIALNDEIAALTRTGLPLERGLMSIGGDLPGRLGKISRRLADDLASGKSLSEAVEADKGQFPPIYRAVIDAGMRSGRLASALEALAEYARGYTEMRRLLGLALMYPLIVLSVGYGLFLTFMLVLLPRFLGAFESLGVHPSRFLTTLERLNSTALYWGPIVPILLLILGLTWTWSGSARSVPGGGLLVRRVPWMRGMLANSQSANFADLLALLVEHEVPFADAVELSAGASADVKMVKAAKEVAAGIRAGEAAPEAVDRAHIFPPLLRWLIVTGCRQGTLVDALRHAGESYRRRAILQAQLARTFLPTILLILIGATGTALVTSLLFIPFSTLVKQLSLG
jgi:type II secretory pathway component PulF